MTAALTWARLSYRQQRWELILIALGVAATAGAMLWFASQVTAMVAANPTCLPPDMQTGIVPATCEATLNAYYELAGTASNVLSLAIPAPFGIGILLGAPLVAREIDAGTAQLAWSIGRSRTWWLLRRIAFIALFAAIALGVLAVTSTVLTGALYPGRDLSADFAYYDSRGWLIVARGFGALMLGMLVGALIGRVLPAVLAAALVVGVVFVGMAFAMNQWNRSEAVPVRFSAGAADESALTIDFGVEMLDGELVSYGDLYRRGIEVGWTDQEGRVYTSEADFNLSRNYIGHEVQIVIPGRRYPEVVARESGVAAGIGLLALGATAFVVRRRRPV